MLLAPLQFEPFGDVTVDFDGTDDVSLGIEQRKDASTDGNLLPVDDDGVFEVLRRDSRLQYLPHHRVIRLSVVEEAIVEQFARFAVEQTPAGPI